MKRFLRSPPLTVIALLVTTLPACTSEKVSSSEISSSENSLTETSPSETSPSETSPETSSSSSGRAVSLKVLQRLAQTCRDTGRPCPEEVEKLGGLTYLMGYVVDLQNRDLILVGKADPRLPPLYLDDFAIALRNAWLKYAERRGNTFIYSSLGCSIDPDPETYEKLQLLTNQINATPDMVEEVIKKWHAVCQSPEQVRVIGMPFNTRFGKVLVEADYAMKKIVDGSDRIAGFSSVVNRSLEVVKERVLSGRMAEVNIRGVSRFEFVPGRSTYQRDQGLVLLEDCPVTLITEEEYLTQTGQFAGTGQPHPVAKAFAEEITERYAELGRERSIYAEVEGLFRLAAVAHLLHEDEELKASGVDLSYLLDRLPVREVEVQSQLPGVSNVEQFRHREESEGGYQEWQIWLPSCGGVQIAFELGVNPILLRIPGKGPWTRRTILALRPSLARLFWDLVFQ